MRNRYNDNNDRNYSQRGGLRQGGQNSYQSSGRDWDYMNSGREYNDYNNDRDFSGMSGYGTPYRSSGSNYRGQTGYGSDRDQDQGRYGYEGRISDQDRYGSQRPRQDYGSSYEDEGFEDNLNSSGRYGNLTGSYRDLGYDMSRNNEDYERPSYTNRNYRGNYGDYDEYDEEVPNTRYSAESADLEDWYEDDLDNDRYQSQDNDRANRGLNQRTRGYRGNY